MIWVVAEMTTEIINKRIKALFFCGLSWFIANGNIGQCGVKFHCLLLQKAVKVDLACSMNRFYIKSVTKAEIYNRFNASSNLLRATKEDNSPTGACFVSYMLVNLVIWESLQIIVCSKRIQELLLNNREHKGIWSN